jgi:thiol-disulfide isomerase/thioredoxin
VNFWAAWCGPCLEEIPRLKQWETQLSGSLRVVFVSLDDDPRQLGQFLQSQPIDGLRHTYWLTEGREREEWLTAAGLKGDPELPVHLLVDPNGRIRCTIRGAVDESDYADLAALVGG